MARWTLEKLGFAGWKFDIRGPIASTRSTDANGQININDLPPGKYIITEMLADPPGITLPL
jgi:Prealbumin-like fold domain